MTEAEWSVLVGFLTGGCLVGVVGHWFDLVTATVRGSK